MAATVIDGRGIAERLRARIGERVERVKARGGHVRLDALLVDSGDSAARVYATSQGKRCEELGIEYRLHELHAGASEDDIAGRVLVLNESEGCSAMMVHLPLPDDVEPYRIQRLIHPDKDVEGVNPANIGNIVYGRSSLAPCTALATITILEEIGIKLLGKRCVVVGAGDVVGKPIAVLLMRHEATVVSCNIHTERLEELCESADVLIAAAGKPGLINAGMVREGAVVIDVGVNRVEDEEGTTRTVGDVAFDGVSAVASMVSPVPGGVGPVTVAMLLSNVVLAAERRVGLIA